MDKLKCYLYTFLQYLLSPRLLCFVLLQFCSMHHKLKNLKLLCHQANYPVTPYFLPFVIQNYYFILFYGMCCVYFFSNIPFFQSEQLYYMVRMGRKKWMAEKIAKVWSASLCLVLLEQLIGIFILLPNLEWTTDWGSMLHSLSITDIAVQYNIRLAFPVPYQILIKYTPLQAVGLNLLLMFLVTGFLGMLMLLISLYFSRNTAILTTSCLCVMTLFFANYTQFPIAKYLLPFTPLEWMDLLLLNGDLCKVHPTPLGIIIGILLFAITATILCIFKMEHIDIQLTNEE